MVLEAFKVISGDGNGNRIIGEGHKLDCWMENLILRSEEPFQVSGLLFHYPSVSLNLRGTKELPDKPAHLALLCACHIQNRKKTFTLESENFPLHS